MKARLALVALAVVVTGCTGPALDPTTPAPTTPVAVQTTPATTPASTATTPEPGESRTPVAGRTTLILGGTAIGDRPLGATPQSLLDPDLDARLGKPKVGRTQLCQLAGERDRFAVVDHSWSGLTVHYGRIDGATVAIGWQVALDRVPDGVRLVDRLPWRPTFAELAASDGVDVESSAGVKTARLSGRAIGYSGPAGTPSPDTVTGGPELTCR
ncbi:MAG TPA: hypothetical protein VGK18_15025 [Propionicimonas sp.]|uniref:hypothetical protein n=1 Tax=Propionicimonas sp. TaxID=1955623 RepID=UPI002F419891